MSHAALWCKSNFSFLEGASHPHELVERAAALGLSALALTDRDGVHGVVRAHVAARELAERTERREPVKLIIGAQVSVASGADPAEQLLLLAQSRAGYANLCSLLTTGRRRAAKGESRVSWEEVCHAPSGLIADGR